MLLFSIARWGNMLELWSVGVFCLTFYCLLNFWDWFRMCRMVAKLPGPKGHFLSGNAKDYASKTGVLPSILKWRQRFPSFHKTFIFFYPVLIAQSPEAAQVLLSRHKHSEKGFIYKAIRPLLGEGLVVSKGEKWHSHRRLITPTFHFNVLASFVDVFVARTKDFMQQLAAIQNSSEFIDISPYTRKLTMDLICETAMGISCRDQPGAGSLEIITSMHKLEEISCYRMIRPWLLIDFYFQFTSKGREQEKYKNILHSFTEKIIQKRRVSLKEQEAKNIPEDTGKRKKAIFMDLLLESSENGQLLTDQDIREEVNTFMFAGQNTTQLATNYCLYLLGLNQKEQDRAYEELSQIFGNSDREPSLDDLKEMRYLERCIKESLRLYPSIPCIGRKLTEDERIGKHLLPKGADVLLFTYALHRDEEQFPNPEVFNPDNFLPEKILQRHPYAYIPFSAGPRNCLGQKFSLLAQKTVISSVLRKYQVKSKHSREEMLVVPNIVLVPKNGIKLKLIPR